MTVTTGVSRAVGGSAEFGEGAVASAWLQALVSGPPRPLRVAGISGPASYLRVDGGDVVALEATGGVRLPNAMALDPTGPGVAGLALDAAGVIGRGAVRVGSRTITVRRWWDPRPTVGTLEIAALATRRGRLPALPAVPHGAFGLVGPITRLADAARRRDHRALPRAVADLVGRGPGSTPTGDDVLAGLLATLRVFRVATDRDVVGFTDVLDREIQRAAPGTTALSATLLRCADSGAVVAAAGRMLQALAGHRPVVAAITELDRLGHTSGRDLLAGITIAVDALTTGGGRL